MVKINGCDVEAAGQTLAEYLQNANYDERTIVIELNEEIVPKTQYGSTVIKDGDTIEIISFMGGG
ncbi:MAG: sulfur carrier protein ThiS [Selenomonadaceae bacterium]|nr:sulfur carrier protein ThiS [Selenomonadaceae bacterium]MBR1858700.1 sulfur carrier protein ThiS [Selenomonadaceae bacterium]